MDAKAGYWDLTLECGHKALRTARPRGLGPLAPPKRVSCAQCLCEPYLYVKFEQVHRAGLTADQVLAATELAFTELALAQSLVMIHGEQGGRKRYYETGGLVWVDVHGSAWVPVSPSGVIISRPA